MWTTRMSGRFVLLCWATFMVVWLVSALSVKATKERQPLPRRLVHLLLAAVAVLAITANIGGFKMSRGVLPRRLAVELAAMMLVSGGLVVAIWARVVLGANWSARVTFKEDHELIQRGPYRVVRHPIYSGLLLMVLGTAVFFGRVGGFVAFPVYLLAICMKLNQEEALLTRHFPEAYPEYKSRTKALVPFVW